MTEMGKSDKFCCRVDKFLSRLIRGFVIFVFLAVPAFILISIFVTYPMIPVCMFFFAFMCLLFGYVAARHNEKEGKK